jgi:hypothetical protein
MVFTSPSVNGRRPLYSSDPSVVMCLTRLSLLKAARPSYSSTVVDWLHADKTIAAVPANSKCLINLAIVKFDFNEYRNLPNGFINFGA